MTSTQLITERTKADAYESTDVECPDCGASLVVYYDHEHHTRYYCDNCDQEVNPNGIEANWDESRSLENYCDNNINIVDIDPSYIGLS